MSAAQRERSASNSDIVKSNPSVPCLKTGIKAFDLGTGGLPEHKLTLVAGGQSTGKSILGLEFLCQGLEDDERVILLTSDAPEVWLKSAQAFGWPLDNAVENGNLNIIYQKSQIPHVITNSEELNHMLDMLESEILPWEPTRLLIDSAVPFIELIHPDFRMQAISRVISRLNQMEVTTMMVTRMPASGETMSLMKLMENLSGCSLHLDEQKTPAGESRRRMVCRKHTAVQPPYPVYDFTIEQGQGILTDGASAVPLQAPAEEVKLPQKPKAKSGLFASAMSQAKANKKANKVSEQASAGSKKEGSGQPDEKKSVRYSFKASDSDSAKD